MCARYALAAVGCCSSNRAISSISSLGPHRLQQIRVAQQAFLGEHTAKRQDVTYAHFVFLRQTTSQSRGEPILGRSTNSVDTGNIGRLYHRACFRDIQDLTAERTMTTVEDDHGHLQNSLAITALPLSSLVPPDDPCSSLTLTESHGLCDRSIMRGDLKIEGIERQTLCHRQSRWSLNGGLGRTLKGRQSDPAAWESSTLPQVNIAS